MGKIEGEECGSNRNEARQAHNVSVGSSEDRSGAAGTVGEGQAREESGLKEKRPRIQSAPLAYDISFTFHASDF
ncbi:MAG: hypothetical protein LAO18_22930 [Acidobacteriia bacterium]|nr:hypothetical protein [Terriglobia bacterium]